MPAVGEHLEPLVEGGNLGLEEDVPFFEEAEATLFGGGVVAVPPCLDGPGDGEWGACPLQSPHMLAEGGAFCALHVLVLHVMGVSPVSLLEGGLTVSQYANSMYPDILMIKRWWYFESTEKKSTGEESRDDPDIR